MKPNRIYLFLFALLLAAASCKPKRETLIIGLWQEVAVHNHQLDSDLDRQLRFIDTVGTQTDSAGNFAAYGTTNIDTFKKNMRANIDSFKRAQNKAVAETWFDFHKNGVVYLHSERGLDSANWSFEDENLILDRQKSGGEKMARTVQVLNDTALQLHGTEKFLDRTSEFRKVKR